MCDTFVALPNATSDGSVIFAKNSDREANEAQQLEFHKAKIYKPGVELACTYISIPQTKKTHAVLLSRPFWMWGAEMGANEHGVVIGNEAVFTKLPVTQKGVLTGMDLLRLGLERGKSAKEAKDVIIELLGKYGQGGISGYMDKSFTYHNSFIIADKKEGWVLETAGEFWVAKKIASYYAISNGLTIENEYDEIHDGAEAFARKKGWVKKTFGFASAYSDKLYTRFSDCKLRQHQTTSFLAGNKITVPAAFTHLRSHHQEPYNPATHLLSNSICAHAGNPLTRHASQTTGSLVVHLTSEKPIFWVTATSAPCLSMFKPVWFGSHVLPNLDSTFAQKFDKSSYWWLFEELHREVLKDYNTRAPIVQKEQQLLEKALLELVYEEGEQGFEVTTEAFSRSRNLNEDLIRKIKKITPKKSLHIFYNAYWRNLNKTAGINL